MAQARGPRRAGRPSYGQLAGLRKTDDALDLKSSVALVMDQDTNEVLVAKNSDAVLPIASITKLMTAWWWSPGATAAGRDADHLAGRRRHREGQPFAPARRARAHPREMLHLALMSSENRAAHALGRPIRAGSMPSCRR